MMLFATGNRFAARLQRILGRQAFDRATGHKCRFPIDDVEDVGFFCVNFDREGSGLAVAMCTLDRECWVVHEGPAVIASGNLFMPNHHRLGNWCRRCTTTATTPTGTTPRRLLGSKSNRSGND